MSLFNRFRKKKHIKNQMSVLEKKMWDIEFLIEKTKAQREDFRNEYDRISELVDAATRRLEEEEKKEDKDKTIIDNLNKYKERYIPDLEQLKVQMEAIDSQIEGGQNSFKETIEGYRTVIKMLKEWSKKI